MRYIGNKTRLRSFICRVLRQRGIRSGRALDPFCGTASVSRTLKRCGFSVQTSDVMRYGYVFGRAYVETAARPDSLRVIVRELNRLPSVHGFVTEHYTPAGPEGRQHGRMYFTAENAMRVDAIRSWLADHEGELGADVFYACLAALIEAADRVANTTGVYAACVKSWQPNAVRPLELQALPVITGNSCHAYQCDATALIEQTGPFELLYLDPPYNTRQYPGYYHIPELIANGWFAEVPRLRGKTGLLDDDEKRSAWCSRKAAENALGRLLESAKCKHIVLSYNTEGIIPEETIERLLRSYGRTATYRRYNHSYKRYRSDSDHERRRYRGDVVTEHLYCVSR
jgi:adenine-specific DNA-methyltransferase